MKAGLMICVSLIALGWLANPGRAEESTSAFFEKTVWAKVGERTCLKCHKAGGEAEESKFVLTDPKRSQDQSRVGEGRPPPITSPLVTPDMRISRIRRSQIPLATSVRGGK